MKSALPLVLCIALVSTLFMVSPAVPWAAAAPGKMVTLSHGNKEHDELTTYGGRGYAIRYKVPDDTKKWYAMTVQVDGESYGNFARKDRFKISFMDMEGNVYAESEHAFSLFTGEPKWVDIRVTPTELPPEFWVVVDFRPTKDKGVYIGYRRTGKNSQLTDEYCNLIEMEEALEWCITLKVRDEVKGNTLAYDSSTFKERKTPEGVAVPKKIEFYEESSEHVALRYKGIEKTWARSIVLLLDTALAGFQKLYGMEIAQPIKIQVEVNPDEEATEIQVQEDGSLVWRLASKNELLPISRGGKHRHVLNFCRALAALSMADRFDLAEYAPEGQEEGISTYLSSRVVSHIFVACSKELWPVAYNYHLEEGPKYVGGWIDENLQDPARRIAAILRAVQEKLGDDAFYALMQTLFQERIAARDWARTLHDELAKNLPDGDQDPWLAETIPVDLLNPPILWFAGKPDFIDPVSFAGLKARRFKTQLFLSYDDGSNESSAHLPEEKHLLRVMPPPGTWRLANLKIFCRRNGQSKEAMIRVEILDEALVSLGHSLVPLQQVQEKKFKWQALSPLPEVDLTAPFYLAISTEAASGANLEIGLDDSVSPSHSALFMPGSHVDDAPGKGDWMMRLYIEPDPPQDKAGLDSSLKALRKQLK